jgi:hypothetical protein
MDSQDTEKVSCSQDTDMRSGEILIGSIGKPIRAGLVLDPTEKTIESRSDNLEDETNRALLEVNQYPVGVAYKKTGSADLWRRIGNREINITQQTNNNTAMPPGSCRDPSFTFTTSTDSGLFMNNSDSVGVTVCGLERMRVGRNATRLMNVLELTDMSTSIPTEQTVGKLFKKPGSNGLWWGTADGVINLLEGTKEKVFVSGDVSKPGYSFDDNPTLGVFIEEPINVGLLVNEPKRVSFKQSEAVSTNPLQPIAGTSDLPSYSFSDSKKTGIYLPALDSIGFTTGGIESLRISKESIKVMTGVVLMHADGGASMPGISFTNESSSGLWRKESGVLAVSCLGSEIILASKDGVDVNGSINIKQVAGGKNMFGFAAQGCGMRSDDGGNLLLVSGGEDVVQIGKRVNMRKPLCVAEVCVGGGAIEGKSSLDLVYETVGVSLDARALTVNRPVELVGTDGKAGRLYKETDSDGLWWRSGEYVKDLTDIDVKFPLRAGISSLDYTFEHDNKTGMRLMNVGHLSLSVGGYDQLMLTRNMATIDSALAVNGHIALNEGKSVPHSLHRSGEKLFWSDDKNNSVDLTVGEFVGGTLSEQLLVDNGEANAPGIAFTGDADTGLRLLMPNMMSFACGGMDRVLFTEGGLRVKSLYAFIDGNVSLTNVDSNLNVVVSGKEVLTVSADQVAIDGDLWVSDGRLHTHDGHLMWSSNNVSTCLTETTSFPLMASTDGDHSTPVYSFESDPSSGMCVTADGVSIVSKGKLAMIFGPDTVFSKKYTLPGDEHSISTVGNDIVIASGSVNRLVVGNDVSAESFSANAYKLADGGSITSIGGAVDLAARYVNLVGKDASLVVGDTIAMTGQLVVDGADINVSGGVLTTKTGGKKCTYQSSETFGVAMDVKLGDVVGIQNDGRGCISMVSGGNWSNEMKIPDGKSGDTSRTAIWDTFDSTRDIRLYTKAQAVDNVSTLSLAITVFKDSVQVGSMSIDLVTVQVEDNKPHTHAVGLCKLINNKYVVAFGDYNNMQLITLRQFRVNINGCVPDILVESEVLHETESTETFDLVYENTGSLDMLVLVMYSASNGNLNVAMFSCLPHLQVGYCQNNISADPIIGNNKTLRVVLLPGQVIVCSYGNHKCFILLPSVATESFNVGDTIIDNDSSDCVDIIYDDTNSVILSVERTYTDNAFLQVSDIFGTKIAILRTKKLGRSTYIPLGLGYNPITDNFVLFYADSTISGQIYAQVFTHDGESINLGLTYARHNSSNLYTTPELVDGTPVPAHGKQVWLRSSNILSVEWVSGKDSSSIACFDDNFGIQAAAYIGLAMHDATADSYCEVAIKGQVFTGIRLPNNYVGKKLFLDSDISKSHPDNLTVKASGNMFLGTCLTSEKILVGL